MKYFSSFISVSNGRVVFISEPKIDFCPLASHFYEELRDVQADKEELKKSIQKVIEFKIKEYGFFTPDRSFNTGEIQVPFGASEMLMLALRHKAIEAAVVVCDGAGTLISSSPEIVQGIGARMHNIVMTSPISETIKHLNSLGCLIVSSGAEIDQFQGVRKAAQKGYKTIGVTIDAHSAGRLDVLKDIEKQYGVKVISLVVCTSGIKREAVEEISRYADLVWSCLSADVRKKIGPLSKIQFSELMPVFVISERGADFAAGCYPNLAGFTPGIKKKRYLVSLRNSGRRISTGRFAAYIEERELPVISPELSGYWGMDFSTFEPAESC